MYAVFKGEDQISKPNVNKQLLLLDAMNNGWGIPIRSSDGSCVNDVTLLDGYEIRPIVVDG